MRKQERNGRKSNAPCIDATSARSHQYERYLHKPEWRAAVQTVLDAGALPRRNLVDALVHAGHKPARAASAVTALCRLAVLEDAGDGLRVQSGVARVLARGAS